MMQYMTPEPQADRAFSPVSPTLAVTDSTEVVEGHGQRGTRKHPVTTDRSVDRIDIPATNECSTTAVTVEPPLQYDDEVRPKVVFSLMIRQRVREASQQVHDLVVQRMRDATRPDGPATWPGLEAEVREIARVQVAHAQKKAQDGDVRAALVALGATAILLAEQVDRPDEPKRGTARASTKRWRPIDFRMTGVVARAEL